MPEDNETIEQLWAKLVAESSEDQNLRQRLLEEPASVLRENGVEVPEGATIKTLEKDDRTIALTVTTNADGDLSEEELESVAGGNKTLPSGLYAEADDASPVRIEAGLRIRVFGEVTGATHPDTWNGGG